MCKSTQGVLILSKATVLLKSTQNLILPCQTGESSLSSWSTKNNAEFLNIYQSKGFRESNLFLHFCRNSHCLSVLLYIAPLSPYISYLTFWRVKVSLLAGKNATIGCILNFWTIVSVHFCMKATLWITKYVCLLVHNFYRVAWSVTLVR